MLELALIDRQAVHPIAQPAMDFRIDRIADAPHRSVAKRHVERARMRAAESRVVGHPRGILQRRQCAARIGRDVRGGRGRIAENIVVVAGVAVFVVAAVVGGFVDVGIQIFFAVEIRVAGAVGNHRHGDFASLEGDAGQRGRVVPAIGGRASRCADAARSGPKLIVAAVAAIGRIVVLDFKHHARVAIVGHESAQHVGIQLGRAAARTVVQRQRRGHQRLSGSHLGWRDIARAGERSRPQLGQRPLLHVIQQAVRPNPPAGFCPCRYRRRRSNPNPSRRSEKTAWPTHAVGPRGPFA